MNWRKKKIEYELFYLVLLKYLKAIFVIYVFESQYADTEQRVPVALSKFLTYEGGAG